MAIKHATTKAPLDTLKAVEDWNADHTGTATPTTHGNEAHNPEFLPSASETSINFGWNHGDFGFDLLDGSFLIEGKAYASVVVENYGIHGGTIQLTSDTTTSINCTDLNLNPSANIMIGGAPGSSGSVTFKDILGRAHTLTWTKGLITGFT